MPNVVIVSYNLLHPFYAVQHQTPNGIIWTPRGEIRSNWDTRAPELAENLRAAAFDVACLQEVGAEAARMLAESFTLLRPAPPAQAESVFTNALLYNPATMRLEETFTLAKRESGDVRLTPAFMGVFTHIESGVRIAVVSVHLKGYYPHMMDSEAVQGSRQAGFLQLGQHLAEAVEYAAAQGCTRIVMAGDFNEDHIGGPLGRIDRMLQNGFQHDGVYAASEAETGRKIDWIFARGAALEPVTVDWPHPKASDHLPVTSRLILG